MTKIPPLVIFVFCAIIMTFLPAKYPLLEMKGISIILGFIAVGLGFVTLYQVRKANTPIDPFHPERATVLLQTGMYSISRNPMYLSLALALFAYFGWLGHLLALVGVLFFVWYMNTFQIKAEEQALQQKFGDEYLAYLFKVRRWI